MLVEAFYSRSIDHPSRISNDLKFPFHVAFPIETNVKTYRAYLFTSYDMDHDWSSGLPVALTADIRAAVWQIGYYLPSKKHFVNGYIEFNNSFRPTTVRNKFSEPSKVLLGRRQCTSKTAADLCASDLLHESDGYLYKKFKTTKHGKKGCGPWMIGKFDESRFNRGPRRDDIFMDLIAELINGESFDELRLKRSDDMRIHAKFMDKLENKFKFLERKVKDKSKDYVETSN